MHNERSQKVNPLRLLAVPALTDNYIWLLADTQHAIIVDPGETAPVHAALTREALIPSAILLTHHHADHIAGAPQLAQEFSIPIYAPQDERIAFPTRFVQDGERLVFTKPNIEFTILAVPGHTRTHIAYFGADILFCGDTLFSVGCGRLFEGTPAQMLASLDRLRALPANTQLCCGHEYTLANCAFAITVDKDNPALQARFQIAKNLRANRIATLPSTLAQECATNPFLRVDEPALIRHLTISFDITEANRIERFARLRARKDNFRSPMQ